MISKNFICIACIMAVFSAPLFAQEQQEITIIKTLVRLRNEHKADSAGLYFADTVVRYMKYLRNVPRSKIVASDKAFWKAHPGNRFEITGPVNILLRNGQTVGIITGKEYLDGTSYKRERIEIIFNKNKKIISYRGFNIGN
ncbi:MAG: hypothetical protein JNM88_17205 [Chitinophagaceae bacterium]|nr:hypothetical protein [Chitinophagaceae bacterium]